MAVQMGMTNFSSQNVEKNLRTITSGCPAFVPSNKAAVKRTRRTSIWRAMAKMAARIMNAPRGRCQSMTAHTSPARRCGPLYGWFITTRRLSLCGPGRLKRSRFAANSRSPAPPTWPMRTTVLPSATT